MIYQVELLLLTTAGREGSPQTPSFFHTDILYIESWRFFTFYLTFPGCIYCVGVVSG